MRDEGEVFRPYNKGGLNIKILIIDLPEANVRDPILLRAEQTWKVKELKTELARVSMLSQQFHVARLAVCLC